MIVVKDKIYISALITVKIQGAWGKHALIFNKNEVGVSLTLHVFVKSISIPR